MARTQTLFARRRTSHTLHVVTGIFGWYSGMTGRTECGVEHVDVLESPATKDHALLCKRCARILGWDRSAR